MKPAPVHIPRICASPSQKPFRDFSRKKRNLLAWSLRSASASNVASHGESSRRSKPMKETDRTVSCGPEVIDADDFFNQQPKASSHPSQADRAAVDIDTLPNLEPYRREVIAQQPITFGHRPLSASRMFNPCTMATSCGIPSGGDNNPSSSGISGRKGGTKIARRGTSRSQRQSLPKRLMRSKNRRATGLSAPMLKALLKRDPPTGGGAVAAAVVATASDHVKTQPDHFHPRSVDLFQDWTTEAAYMALNGREDLSDCSLNSNHLEKSVWRPIDPAGGGMRGDLKATWLTNSSQGGLQQGSGRLGGSTEELELRRIFSDAVKTRESSHAGRWWKILLL